MRKYLLVFLSFFFVLSLQAYRIEEIPNVHVLDRTRFLSNPDRIISRQANSMADSIMQDIWRNSTVEIVAVVVDSISSETDPETFATELMEFWGVGKKDNDNGLLLLISLKDRASVIRTGYGIEGIVPDITAGKIIRNKMFPLLRKGDYDNALIESLLALREVILKQENVSELKSKYLNDEKSNGFSEDDNFWIGYLSLGVLFMIVSLLYIFYCTTKYRKNHRRQWEKLDGFKLPLLIFTFFFLGIPVVSYLLLKWNLKRLRVMAPLCQRCSTEMKKLIPGEDNRWLTNGQQTERRLKSVEHDVWECPECGYGEVLSYRNSRSNYTKCPKCEAVALHMVEDRTLRHPTTVSMGTGERVYRCENCGDEYSKRYSIPRKTPVVITSFGGGRGFGGGISGGSFGGGHTGGGGASGRW